MKETDHRPAASYGYINESIREKIQIPTERHGYINNCVTEQI